MSRVDVDAKTPVLLDPKGHSFEPFAGTANAATGASCCHCGRERGEHPAVKCGTYCCNDDASVRAYWPGRSIDFCAPCAVRAVKVSGALGFKLDVAPLALAGSGLM